MKRIFWQTPTGFSLQASSEFYAGFTPGSGMAVADAQQLTLAFRLDQTFEAVAVGLREGEGKILADVEGTADVAAVRKQVSRMLGLDADAKAWAKVGEKDPVVGKLQREFSGFFTAAKPSPYDAAAWGVIAARINMKQAARIKMGLAAQCGDTVTLHGRSHAVFPSPKQLLQVPAFEGLSEVKLSRLKGIAVAALEGKLDAEVLRGLDEKTALAALQELEGVGPWTASHILYRGAALIDAVPEAEPRVLHGLAAAYGLKAATVETMRELSENWRPFRMWVCVLLARHLGKIGGWNNKSLGKERAKAGRALMRT